MIKWDIIGLSKVRIKGEELVELERGHFFYNGGKETGRKNGVGFLINKRIINHLLEVENTLDKAARFVVQLIQRYQLQIVEAYAPTLRNTDVEVD